MIGFRRALRALVLLLVGGLPVVLVPACTWIAVHDAPAKQARPASPDAARLAAAFWTALHSGDYASIDSLLEQHDREVLANPGDAVTLAHAGWLHAWKVSERVREPAAARSIEHISLARRYFDEAVALEPQEARYLGFAAGFTMAEARVLGDERLQRTGYYRMREAVAAFPEFNLFTSGYVMSSNPAGSDPFREGLEQQWQNLDRCFGVRVDRRAPELRQYLGLETRQGPKRVCWNSWIAPHNWEGFFLNFGDTLARAGDPRAARTMYEATRLSASYADWPLRRVLERRLAQLDGLGDRLNHAPPGEREWRPMIDSAFACMACHQEGGDPPLPEGR